MNGQVLNSTGLIVIAVTVLVLLLAAGWLSRRRPGKLNIQKFNDRWQAVQKQCANPDTWPLAIIDADKLLDEALKRSHYRGKTMGERLVAAQRDLTDNDGVWFGHKLRNKLVHEDFKGLKKRIVFDALQGFRQALKDLGALK